MIAGRRAAAGAAVAVAAVVLLAGACGGGGPDAAGRVREAADQTLAAGSARASIRLAYTGGGVDAGVTGDGVVDLAQRRATFSLDLGSLGSLFGGDVDAVVDGSGIYVKAPPALRAAKPWLKVDLAALGSQAGIDIGALSALQTADLASALGFLERGASGMEKVGSERVRGASTTHYRGTLDLGQAIEGLSPEARKPAQDIAEALGHPRVPADVWLDGEGRLRKVRLAISSAGANAPGEGSVEFELYDFGLQADIDVPPADQVTDLFGAIFGGSRPR